MAKKNREKSAVRSVRVVGFTLGIIIVYVSGL